MRNFLKVTRVAEETRRREEMKERRHQRRMEVMAAQGILPTKIKKIEKPKRNFKILNRHRSWMARKENEEGKERIAEMTEVKMEEKIEEKIEETADAERDKSKRQPSTRKSSRSIYTEPKFYEQPIVMREPHVSPFFQQQRGKVREASASSSSSSSSSEEEDDEVSSSPEDCEDSEVATSDRWLRK